jgi:uncharacterized protein YjbJ (UPF0337 family)
MNQHRFTGNRKEFRGKARKYRGKPTVDPLDTAAGTGDRLADSVREPYGISNEEAARQLDGFLDRNRDWDPSHG